MPVLFRRVSATALAAAALFLVGCASRPAAESLVRNEVVYAVTASNALIQFKAAEPSRILATKPLVGADPADPLVGVDFRVSRGVLFGVSRAGRVYTIDTATGALKPVSAKPAAVPLQGETFGIDFNPTVDRIRVVNETGQNLRLHPDTGAVVDGDAQAEGVQPDGALHYVAGDVNFGRKPAIAGAAYTYNTKNDKITTNYAIDRQWGVLAMQGSREGETPVVSPNTGQLRTVGSLGLGALTDVAFDIADVGNTALMAARTQADPRTRLFVLDLSSGRATELGLVGDGAPLRGMAIQP